MSKDDVKGLVKRFSERLAAAPPAAGGLDESAGAGAQDGNDLRDRLKGVDGKKPDAEKPGAKVDEFYIGEDDDSRTLWVDVDAHGLRRKVYEKCVLESFAVPYGESSRIRGPPTTMHTMQYLLENGGDPRLWLEVFRTSKGIARSDRVWHELNVLVDMFWYGRMVDQLNLPALICFEVLSRRILAMIEAYSDPQRVNWSTSRFYTGTAGLDDAAPPEMRTFVSRSARELQDMEATRQRISTLAGKQSAGQGAGDGGGGDGGGAEGGGRGGGKGGRGRGGRTRAPPGPKP